MEHLLKSMHRKWNILSLDLEQVTELRAVGLSYTEIAQQLQVSRASIGSDLQYIREQAKQSIK